MSVRHRKPVPVEPGDPVRALLLQHLPAILPGLAHSPGQAADVQVRESLHGSLVNF
jgi:hypothetical protein